MYAVISYYLKHKDEVEDYLRRREELAAKYGAPIEAGQPSRARFREELLARRAKSKTTMLRMASDADFNGDVLRGLFRRRPDLDLIRVQDVGLRTADDETILEWAAGGGRILLTHDRTTMPNFAYQRVTGGRPMSGVFVIRNKPPLGEMIDEILMVALCSFQEEWKDRVEFLPL